MTKILAAVFLFTTPLFAADRLSTVLSQMDAASAKFKSAQADLTQENYERVVRETTTDKGTVYFKGQGASLEMGLKLDPPTARLVNYKNGVVRVYDPGPNQITEIRSGQIATYLAVAFGGSGKDLANAWEITDKGAEQIDGVSVEHLDLVSKDAEARAKVSHVEIWVDPARAISLKQQVFLPGGNYKISTYRNIRYNQEIKTGPYIIKPNKSTTVTHPS